MSDLPNEFWGGWIAVVTVVSLLVLAWLIISIYFTDSGPQEAEYQVWDENLREGTTPAPLWWFWLILGLMVFSVIYLMLYPGLGSFRGALNWSQGHHVEARAYDYEQQFGSRRNAIANMELAVLQRDSEAMRAAEGVFSRNCAVCHGYDALGQANAFPNLKDDVWQWGGSPAQVEQSIRQGRQALMVGWEETIDAGALDDVSRFVAELGDSPAADHPGRTVFATYCAACHGPEGRGQPALGAPDLTDDDWLYGGSYEAIYETIAKGRHGIMPAFDARLDDAQVRMLVAWLLR